MSVYSKKIYPFVERLIRDHNQDSGRTLYELSFDDLELDEQQALAKMMLVHHDDGLDFMNDDLDQIRFELVQMLDNPDTDNRLWFAEQMMEKVVKYYKSDIQKIIDEIIGWVEQEDMEEAGLARGKHQDNGESYWIRGL